MADPFEGFSGLSPLVTKKGKGFGNINKTNPTASPFGETMSGDGWTLPKTFEQTPHSDSFMGTNGVNMSNRGYYNDLNSLGSKDYGSLVDGSIEHSAYPVANATASKAIVQQSIDQQPKGLVAQPLDQSGSQSSGPMSYLGDTWNTISGGASSFGSWFKNTFGPTQVDRSYANYLSSLPHQAVSSDQASTINGLYKDGMTTDQIDLANSKALDIYNSNPTDKAMTANEFATNANREQELNNQQWGYGANAALGLGNLGLGVMSYLDKSAYNDKAMDLMDQQIANNKDLMATRKARAADISKAFGSGSAKTI